ncbi:tyrosine-type recombinase/integrase [Ruminococcus sp. NK3A76]|uniref:tyrosine-type recombinase/integrase n=1 Tax=Ruminococcus sp. NK3A76 TaxID=877411 RepID=UPI00048AC6FE|nr:tyrosine-type recombinase/integrase [Ruminococcus sp. NK3A76]
MANVTKRGNSYRIKVSCGYDVHGKQVIQSKSWKPDEGMSARQIEKELQRQIVLFEEECLQGNVIATIKFEEFAKQWFKEYADKKLKAQTIRGYHYLEPRIYKALGHLRLDKITPRHVQKFVNELCEMKCGNNSEKKLSSKTVKLHLSLVSTIFDYAIKMQMIKDNPCKNITLPSPDRKERKIYTVEEIKQILELFDSEPIGNFKYVVFFTLALYTGLRRGELLGLEWKDFDWNKGIMTVSRNSLWTKEKGMYTDTPKTESSIRSLKLQPELIDILMRYKDWQNSYIIDLGDKWQVTDRLFTTWNGSPMHVTSPADYLKEFCRRNNIRYCSPHSWRHLNATLMIESGIDVKTVQACLGHSEPTTTMTCYLHSFQSAQAAAMDAVANAIRIKTKKDTAQKDTAS